MSENKKKKKTLVELVVGSGLIVVFLPIILLALFGALLGLGLGGFMMLTQGNVQIFWPMLLVYGILLSIMTFVIVRFGKRFARLIHRWVRIQQEHQRIDRLGLTDVSENEQLEGDIEETTLKTARR